MLPQVVSSYKMLRLGSIRISNYVRGKNFPLSASIDCLLNFFPQAFVHLNEFDNAKVDLEKVLLTTKLCFVLFLFSSQLCAR